MAQSKSKIPKLDLRKQYKEFYLPSAKEVGLVDVPEFLFIALDGRVKPASVLVTRRLFVRRWRPCTAWATASSSC